MLFLKSLALSLLLISFELFASSYRAKFAPYEGKQAFAEVFKQISNAKDYAYITIYSWSMGGLEEAIESACKNGAKVYVVLNNAQEEGRKLIDAKKNSVVPLEKNCAEFKITDDTMHEKFVVVDDKFASNSSANFSSGAVSRYSETFMFTYDDPEVANQPSDFIINSMKQEFEVLFNYSKNPSFDEDSAPLLLAVTQVKDGVLVHRPHVSNNYEFHSTSMNYEYSLLGDKALKKSAGAFIKDSRLYVCKNDGTVENSWQKCKSKGGSDRKRTVIDMVIEQIKSAEKSIYLGMNYILYDDICDVITEKVKAGLDVRVITDNKQMKNRRDCTRQLSEKFKKKKDITQKLRYKTYSHVPSRVDNYLQHSKYIIIDYDDQNEKPISKNTKLISGSHNLSITGEYANFENMALYKGDEFHEIVEDFYKNFMWMYTLGRDSKDKPKQSIIDRILEPTDKGAYKIHFQDAANVMALTYQEYLGIKDQLEEVAPKMLSWDVPKKVQESCLYYNPKTNEYFGGRNCKKEKKAAGL